MIRLIKNILFTLLICSSVEAQDLFNEANTIKFAGYLFQTQQYSLASQEYERLVFMSPKNADYKLYLIRSYRLNGDFSIARKRFSDLLGDSATYASNTLGTEYLKSTLSQEDLTAAQSFIDKSKNLDQATIRDYQTYIYLLGRNWGKADSLIRNSPALDPNVSMLVQEGMKIKYKSPFLAGTFSAIVPGTGKVYTGFWKDGLVAFLFVAANGWQAYRGFSKNGVKSANGWIFAGLGTGFYLGNIYGSVKSAIKHNKRANDVIYSHAKSVIFSGF